MSSYFIENTTLLYYKDKPVNAFMEGDEDYLVP
jgi:hypothetical protein